MFNTVAIKSDYSILKSIIKLNDLFDFAVLHKVSFLGLVDDNLFGSVEFYDNCIKYKIKPLIALEINLNDRLYYLYAKNNTGYHNLIKINTQMQKEKITIDSLKKYVNDLILVIPFNLKNNYQEFKIVFNDIYIGYKDDYEKKSALVLTKKIIPFNEVNSLEEDNKEYSNILSNIRNDDTKLELTTFVNLNEDDIKILNIFLSEINIVLEKNKRHIPHFESGIDDSFKYLYALCKKGLEKRLNGNINDIYINRLHHELNIIKKMGFVDYFLIVYDYIKYAKNNNIMVGPGRGSAAGSLVSYAIGITNIDPIKYNLLFERFLNPERVTMPDIDVDFDAEKREEVIEYVRKKYGKDKVAPILSYQTLGPRQALKDTAKYYNLDKICDDLTKIIDPKLNLKANLENERIKRMLTIHSELKNVYKIALKLEGLKRQTTIHASGVVISDVSLDDVIPIFCKNDTLLTGLTMNYLEEFGMIKMDFLAINNLTTIFNILELIPEKININKIDLEDKKIYEMFEKGETTGIFQFESDGMRNFLKKLKPKVFSDLYAALALYRPGAMDYIEDFIARKEGKQKIDYIDESLKDILEESYGIIIYQEQIMLILIKMANYSFQEADTIRKAMSKKKEEIILSERDHFINSAIKNGYSKEIATSTYEKILKFAGYGFNKSHSVSYALIGYQMAYLKMNYPIFFVANLLNKSIGDSNKTNEYINLAKKYHIFIEKPDINLSEKKYKIIDNNLIIPLSVIKNLGISSENEIINERNNGKYLDFFDFVKRCYGKSVDKKTLEYLIYSGALDSFKETRNTLLNNIDNAIRYTELLDNLDESLVEKPLLEKEEEFDNKELVKEEYEAYGFYITNHPTSIYQGKDIVKLSQVSNFFNKFIKCVVIIDNIKTIKTKNNQDMAFILCSDETSHLNFVLFANSYPMIKGIKQNDVVEIIGKVTKRLNDFQININKLTKIV